MSRDWSKCRDTSASTSKFHLHICNKQFQFINCGRLLPGVWDGAETSGISCLHYWACGIIRRLSDKKSLKTKPKKSRPTTCKRNLSGICKLSSPSAAKPPSFPCSRAIPLAGWRDHRSVAGVGQVLLITKELLLERHSWASSSGPSAHSCAGRFHLHSWPNCFRVPDLQSSLEADACYSQQTEAGEEEDEPSPENNVKSSKRGAHIALHEIICIYGTLFLWPSTAISVTKAPFWLSVICRSFMPWGKYSRYQIQPDVPGICIMEQ